MAWLGLGTGRPEAYSEWCGLGFLSNRHFFAGEDWHLLGLLQLLLKSSINLWNCGLSHFDPDCHQPMMSQDSNFHPFQCVFHGNWWTLRSWGIFGISGYLIRSTPADEHGDARLALCIGTSNQQTSYSQRMARREFLRQFKLDWKTEQWINKWAMISK